ICCLLSVLSLRPQQLDFQPPISHSTIAGHSCGGASSERWAGFGTYCVLRELPVESSSSCSGPRQSSCYCFFLIRAFDLTHSTTVHTWVAVSPVYMASDQCWMAFISTEWHMYFMQP